MPMGVSVDTKTNRQIMPVCVSVNPIKKRAISPTGKTTLNGGN